MVVGQRIVPNVQFCQEEILKDLLKPVLVLEDKNSVSVSSATVQNSPGKCLRSVVLRAHLESRLVIGLPDAVRQLSVEPEQSLFCILVSKKGDSATHMQEVLLRAFCFENDIYTVLTDSAEKLGRLINNAFGGSCVLVQRSAVNTPAEESLIDFCEDNWDSPIQPVVPLPEP